jgi:hypothetical protein
MGSITNLLIRRGANSMTVAAPVMTIQELLTQQQRVKKRRSEMAAEEKLLSAEQKDLERDILAYLRTQGVDRVDIHGLAVSRHVDIKANVTDWDAVHQFIHDENAFHLLKRELLSSSYNEYLAQGVSIPGTEPFELEKLSVKSARRSG